MTDFDIPDTIDSGSRVRQFYAGQTIFITGGTGFLGKLLLEKLLRTCSDVKAIYVLVRPKKGKDPAKRLEKLFEDIVFDRMKKEIPDYQEKVQLVSGDCTLTGLGLSASDTNTLTQQVTIVFNAAATVRFNEKLKQAISVNVRGTHELLKLCTNMPHLQVIMHVSTAYSNCYRKDIEEKLYDPPISAEEVLQLLTRPDEEVNQLEEEMLGRFPNTYVYTKCIAESLIGKYSDKLPIGISRPAIVLGTLKEPIPGWVDGVQGPTGAIVAAGAGLFRTTLLNGNCRTELLPADYSINILLVAAWAVATEWRKGQDPPIYNYVSSCGSNFTWGRFFDLSTYYGTKIPSTRALWHYEFITTSNYFYHNYLKVVYHYLPALLIDFVLLLMFRKPRAVNIYKKIHKYSELISYFSMSEWDFTCNNSMRLWKILGQEDRELFPFSMENFDWDDYIQKYVAGIRLHIFKDDPSTIPYAKKRMIVLTILHYCVKYGFLLSVVYLLYLIIYHSMTTWISVTT